MYKYRPKRPSLTGTKEEEKGRFYFDCQFRMSLFPPATVRRSVVRGAPFGEDRWSQRVAEQLGLEASLRPLRVLLPALQELVVEFRSRPNPTVVVGHRLDRRGSESERGRQIPCAFALRLPAGRRGLVSTRSCADVATCSPPLTVDLLAQRNQFRSKARGFNRPSSASVNTTVTIPPPASLTCTSYFNRHLLSFEGPSKIKDCPTAATCQ